MSNFLTFCSTFLFFCQCYRQTPRPPINHEVWCSVFLLGKAKEMTLNGNWEQDYRAFGCFANLKTYSLGIQVHDQAEHILDTSRTLVSVNEHQWVSIEHLLNTHWVCMNGNRWVWTPIVERDSPWLRPWERSHLCQNWIHPEHLWVHMNTNGWVMNIPWTLVSAHECQWVSGNIPWTPIECTWMPLSKYLDNLNVHLKGGQFNKFIGLVQIESLNSGIN